MPSFTSDPDHSERARLAADPDVDARARALILDPGVKIADARELVAGAKRIAAGSRKRGFGSHSQALNSSAAQSMALEMGSAHIENGGVVQTPYSTIFGAPRVVAN